MIEILAAYIIDGDTFAVGRDRYRLWGIDAPEITSTQGRRAAGQLADLMNQGPWYCIPKAQDKYGRTVVQCLDAQGADLGCTLISRRAAEEWTYFSGGYYQSCRRAAE